LEGDRDKKVLVIEDSAISRQLIRETLEREGFCVLEAGSTEKGLRLAAQERPRLFLIDLYLPGLDGLEAVGMIRSLEGMDQVPIVMMSAAVSNEERERVMRADCDHYLRKPIDMVELPLLLSRLIKGGRGQAPEEEAG
jgi:DNA-binding response OmpR family regulator